MRFTRKAFIVAAAVAAALVAGVAFAAWTTGGTGHGSAQAKTAVSLTTVGVPASTAGLYPGADAKVTVRVVNDNDFPVRISGVAYGTAAATTVSGALGIVRQRGRRRARVHGPDRSRGRRGRARRDHLRRRRGPHGLVVRDRLPGRDVHHPGDAHGRQHRRPVARPTAGSAHHASLSFSFPGPSDVPPLVAAGRVGAGRRGDGRDARCPRCRPARGRAGGVARKHPRSRLDERVRDLDRALDRRVGVRAGAQPSDRRWPDRDEHRVRHGRHRHVVRCVVPGWRTGRELRRPGLRRDDGRGPRRRGGMCREPACARVHGERSIRRPVAVHGRGRRGNELGGAGECAEPGGGRRHDPTRRLARRAPGPGARRSCPRSLRHRCGLGRGVGHVPVVRGPGVLPLDTHRDEHDRPRIRGRVDESTCGRDLPDRGPGRGRGRLRGRWRGGARHDRQHRAHRRAHDAGRRLRDERDDRELRGRRRHRDGRLGDRRGPHPRRHRHGRTARPDAGRGERRRGVVGHERTARGRHLYGPGRPGRRGGQLGGQRGAHLPDRPDAADHDRDLRPGTGRARSTSARRSR